jgi:UDP-GlcNAc3NAcA epimerase
MKKIVTVVGARPQFIKAAIVSQQIRQENNLKEILVHTGQHYDTNMSRVFFEELGIPHIDYQLSVDPGSQGQQTGNMLANIEKVLIKEKPDWLLIYGDTNSTLAGALAAAKLHIPIAHVEAGLRSYNRKMPEEINRIIADQLAEIFFTPTQQARINLEKEGYALHRIVPVGDVMYDAALFYGEQARKRSNILEILSCKPKEYVLSTIHRAENTDNLDRLSSIFTTLKRLSQTMRIVMPLHPRTSKALEHHHPDLLLNTGITLIDPVGFLDMIMLEKHASLIVTDSGGVQKEAFFYQVPCVTLRDETEWVETVELGWNTLVKPDNADEIYTAISQIGDKNAINGHFPYGNGDASNLIVQRLNQGV